MFQTSFARAVGAVALTALVLSVAPAPHVSAQGDANQLVPANAYKDLRYLESMADAAGIANSLGNAVKNSFGLALANGGEDLFVPMLPERVGQLNGVDLSPKPPQ